MCRLNRSLSLVVVVVAGCSTASIESSWHAPTPPTLNNVVTLSPSSDPGLRRSAEDKLAQQLSHHGVHAVPGYTVLGDQDRSERGRLAQTLASRGFDGIVTMRLVGVNQKLQAYPGFDDYWGGVWGTEVVPETVVRIEINAYALPGKELVGSELSKSVDPNSARQAIGDVAKVATARLAKDHVIGPSPQAG